MNYKLIYSNLINKRKQFPLKKSRNNGIAIHHILPKCLGGSNDSSNLVCLTFKEHFVAHHLLTKIYPYNSGISRAFCFMSNTSKYGKLTSKAYQNFLLNHTNNISKKIKFNDKYYTFKELSILFNLPISTIKCRLYKGYDLITIKELPRFKHLSSRYTFNGKTKSIKEWCKELKINYWTVLDRIQNGWEIEKAIFTPKRNSKKFNVNGTLLTLKEISKLYNINYNTLKNAHTRKKETFNINDLINNYKQNNSNQETYASIPFTE